MSAGHHPSNGPVVGRISSSARYLNSQTIQAALIAIIFGSVLWLVWIYDSGLRDARYLDGWILACGMVFQIGFHVAQKTLGLSPQATLRWRKFHIFCGFLLIGVFISHSDFSLPDTGFEWALWTGFVIVVFSGIFGIYLAWSLLTKRRIDEQTTYERIPERRAELAREVRAIVVETDPTSAALPLPTLPHDDWIKDLYTNRLRDFFSGQSNYVAHLIGSHRPLRRLTDEIDALSPYVDQRSQQKLVIIKDMALEKDRLDFARVYLGLTRAWLFVHGPVTYALTVLIVLHILVSYAYSSGAW